MTNQAVFYVSYCQRYAPGALGLFRIYSAVGAMHLKSRNAMHDYLKSQKRLRFGSLFWLNIPRFPGGCVWKLKMKGFLDLFISCLADL